MVVDGRYHFLFKAVLDKEAWWRLGQCIKVEADRSYMRASGRATNYRHDRMLEVVVADAPSVPPPPAADPTPTPPAPTPPSTSASSTDPAPADSMSAALSKSLARRRPDLHTEWQTLQSEKVRLQKFCKNRPDCLASSQALTKHLQKCSVFVQRARLAVCQGAESDCQALILHGKDQAQALEVAKAALMQAAEAAQQASDKNPVMVGLGTRGLEAEASLE